jgi:hypothetical protein
MGQWARIAFDVYGVKVGIRLSSQGMLEHVRRLLPTNWPASPEVSIRRLYSVVDMESPPESPNRGSVLVVPKELGGAAYKRYSVFVNRRILTRHSHLETAADRLTQDLQLYIASRSETYTFIHAGVVGWHGRVIVIPGRSGSGKSTLVNALVQAGAAYYSDEYAPVDKYGRVHAYLRPLSQRVDGSERHIKHHCFYHLEQPIPGAAPPGLIVACSYRRGAAWRPRLLNSADALLKLLENSVAVRRWPKSTLSTLGQIVQSTECIAGERGESTEIVNHILKRCC